MAKKTTILCIDDDQAIRNLIGDFFAEQGYQALKAGDGEEGLELFDEKSPDIVLVDLRMPKVDGFQVLDKITREAPDTPIIVISGEGEMADVIQALRLGAWNYHTKPIDNLSLISHTVEQALEKARLIKENQAYQRGLEVKLGTMIENFPGFVFICDNLHKLTYMNPALKRYLGNKTSAEHCYKAIFGLEDACDFCPDPLAFHEDVSRFEIQNPKDSRWYHVIQSPVLGPEGTVVERQVVMYDITERKKAELELKEREDYLRKENLRLRASFSDRYKFGEIIGKSEPMQEVYETIINAAASDASVIIYGESGTGKELVAHAIHTNSDRKDKELVYVNCGAIPENLIESEFFGYKKGAFSGAEKDKHGFLDISDGSSLFLDEVGDIPLNMQVKLLRAIEGNGYTPVGGTKVRKPDIRVIAATNRNLKELVKEGKMRQDFLYRIHIIPVHLPPLRERKEDIPLLIDHFLTGNKDADKASAITPRIIKALQHYDWPGNVRELQNTLNRFVTLGKLDFMGLDLQGEAEESKEEYDTDLQGRSLNTIIEEIEKKILANAFAACNYHQGEGKTAEALQIDRKTFYRKMKPCGIFPYHL